MYLASFLQAVARRPSGLTVSNGEASPRRRDSVDNERCKLLGVDMI